jgi:hypothetical protein
LEREGVAGSIRRDRISVLLTIMQNILNYPFLIPEKVKQTNLILMSSAVLILLKHNLERMFQRKRRKGNKRKG